MARDCRPKYAQNGFFSAEYGGKSTLVDRAANYDDMIESLVDALPELIEVLRHRISISQVFPWLGKKPTRIPRGLWRKVRPYLKTVQVTVEPRPRNNRGQFRAPGRVFRHSESNTPGPSSRSSSVKEESEDRGALVLTPSSRASSEQDIEDERTDSLQSWMENWDIIISDSE